MDEQSIRLKIMSLSAKKATDGLSPEEQREYEELRQALAMMKTQKGANR